MAKKIVVTGAGGMIGGHVAAKLLADGHTVRCVDRKPLEKWDQLHDTENVVADLRSQSPCMDAVKDMDEVFNYAADMGGMGFIETHRADCMTSVLITTNMLRASQFYDVDRHFQASSACVYPVGRQDMADATALRESEAWPAQPEVGYGLEKLYGEELCRWFRNDYGIETRVARFHNVYGPHSEWEGGREKAPAAICRKVAEAVCTGKHQIEIWGTGTQTRSFCWIGDAVIGSLALMGSDYPDPVNIGSSELVSINELVSIVEKIAGVELERSYKKDAPLGVRGRNSDNTLCKKVLEWEPCTSLATGMTRLYDWIFERVQERHSQAG